MYTYVYQGEREREREGESDFEGLGHVIMEAAKSEICRLGLKAEHLGKN